MERQDLVTLAADIVAAHVSNNNVAISEIGGLVEKVFASLAGLGATPAVEEEGPKPVVSARASVKPDSITCMICGRKQKTMRRHLQTAHGLSPDEYRQRFGLPFSYPMTAPNYSEMRRVMANQIGLGRKRPVQAKRLSPPARRKARSGTAQKGRRPSR